MSSDGPDHEIRTMRGKIGNDCTPVALSADEAAAIEKSKAAAAKGDFATDEEVQTVWAKYEL